MEFLDAFRDNVCCLRNQMDFLSSCFRDDSAVPAALTAAPAAGELRIRYFGHAAVLLETAQIAVLTDPIIPYTKPGGLVRFTYTDLPRRIDYVLLTHAHQDHVLIETLLQIRHRVGEIIVPKNSGGFLQDPSLRWILGHRIPQRERAR
ncbi:MAG TPA: MBL fold metallo-hydrolase [Steroidobacteraceae bacterium]|nr:MBL fold metallo-hydrolase [Steroidobacteraceae bacterium]